jgi:hypothetical protein
MFVGTILINKRKKHWPYLYNFDHLLCAVQAYHYSVMYIHIPGTRKCTENKSVCRIKCPKALQVLIIFYLYTGNRILTANLNVNFLASCKLFDYILQISVKSQRQGKHNKP